MYKIKKIRFQNHPVLKNLELDFCGLDGNPVDTLFNGLITVYIACLFYSAFAPKNEFKGRVWVLVGLTVLFCGSLMLQLDKAINFVVLLSVVIGL